MSTLGEGPPGEPWRVVCRDATRAVEVVRFEGGCTAYLEGGGSADGGDPRDAVLTLVGRIGLRDGWPVVEILAPGETPRAELLAQVAAQRLAIDGLRAAEGYEARQRVTRAAITAADLVQCCVAEAAPGVPNVGRGLLSKLADDLNAAGFKVPTW